MNPRQKLNRPWLRAITDAKDITMSEIDYFRNSKQCVVRTTIEYVVWFAVESLCCEAVSTHLCAMNNNVESRHVNPHQL